MNKGIYSAIAFPLLDVESALAIPSITSGFK
jgi:hypothetical protein